MPHKEKSPYSAWTIKDILISMQVRADRKDASDRVKHHQENYENNWNLCVVGVLGLILVIGPGRGGSDIDWIDQNAFAFLVAGLVACTWFVLMSLERGSLLSTLSRFTMVRVTTGFLFAAGIAYATSEANTVLNAVFSVDASSMPLARAFLVAALFLKLLWPAFVVLGIIAVISLLMVSAHLKWWVKDERFSTEYREFPLRTLLLAVAAIVVAAVYTKTMRQAFNEADLPEKAYRLAMQLDFNPSAYCLPTQAGQRYLFIGSNQDKVLIAPIPLGEATLQSFATAKSQGMPDFSLPPVHVVSCASSPT
ncbi:MAG TPA: hypothetical protein DHV01_07335 [Rhodoferax sp.]|nr:hypothetical protein [Rhodoferax sp.]